MVHMAAHQPFHGSNKSEKANQNEGTLGVIDDPFTPTSSSHTSDQRRVSHRYSSFDTQLFAHYQPSTSPSSAKRALEAHLSETDRRLEEAAKLGTALVRQRKDISERLKEVEKQQGNGEIGIDLRRKLVEVEKEYNELGRESARSFLAPKARHGGVEETSNGNITLDSRVELLNPLFSDLTNVTYRILPAQQNSLARQLTLPRCSIRGRGSSVIRSQIVWMTSSL